MSTHNENKTAIVSGSSIGIGSHIAESLINDGYNVVMTYFKNKNKAEKLEKKLKKIGNVKLYKLDVSKFSNVNSLVKNSLKNFPSIDLLINNAGIHIDRNVSSMDEISWNKVIETNLGGTFHFCKSVLPQMRKQQYGRIINIGSVVALTGSKGASNYSASKAGIIGFTKSFAKEVAPFGITVNTIVPGFFDNGMFYHLDSKTRQSIIKQIPSKRLGQSHEIADLIKTIIPSSYLTGQSFVLDGGYSI
jgi:3-oxoacyl-[acyl-carrier protein] reductase